MLAEPSVILTPLPKGTSDPEVVVGYLTVSENRDTKLDAGRERKICAGNRIAWECLNSQPPYGFIYERLLLGLKHTDTIHALTRA